MSWPNLTHNLVRKTDRGKSSLFMMRTKGSPCRRPPPCVSAESIISSCYQEVRVTLAGTFISTGITAEPFGHVPIVPRPEGSRSDFPRRYDHRNLPSLMLGLSPDISEEEKRRAAAAAASASSSRDQMLVHRRRAGQDPGATGQAPPLQQRQQ